MTHLDRKVCFVLFVSTRKSAGDFAELQNLTSSSEFATEKNHESDMRSSFYDPDM